MSDYDWRGLEAFKIKYVKNVFNGLEQGFDISEASDHFIIDIEAFWFLKIDEEIAIDMLSSSHFWRLDHLIAVSKHLNNDRDRTVYKTYY